MNHEYYMKLAIDLALKGVGWVNPNPLVGAVIVKDNKIIGEGYHKKYGDLHAERNAFKNADTIGNSSKDGILYVTLEPCCHYGKTPPCTEAIIERGIKKVVIGTLDPNSLVAGKGVDILREAGIEVEVGILEEECININKVFFHYIINKTPYILMKYAMTLDGKIATYTGESKWITNEKSRQYSHNIRSTYTGIMVGVGTVLSDDPLLTTRIINDVDCNEKAKGTKNPKNPKRIICDTNLRTPINAKVVETATEIETIIATAVDNKEKINPYLEKGCKIIKVKKDMNNHIDLQDLMIKLGELNIDSIILEGGSQLNFSALECGVVQEIHTYIAPKIFGGVEAKTPVSGIGFPLVNNGIRIIQKSIQHFDEDILIKSEVKYNCLQEL